MDDELKFVPHEVVRAIKQLAAQANAPYSDGFTQCSYKRDLYVLKCYIDDVYKSCPDFPQQEAEWERDRLMEILKRK